MGKKRVQSAAGPSGVAGGAAEGEEGASQTPVLDEPRKEPTPAVKVVYCKGKKIPGGLLFILDFV